MIAIRQHGFVSFLAVLRSLGIVTSKTLTHDRALNPKPSFKLTAVQFFMSALNILRISVTLFDGIYFEELLNFAHVSSTDQVAWS